MEILTIIISPFIALISGLILWLLNEHSKRQHQVYLEKLKLYEELIISLEGFYLGATDKNKIQSFNRSMAIAWMYCSKEVLEKGDAFLEKTRLNNDFSDEQRDHALDAFIKSIRQDMKLENPNVNFKLWIGS